MPGDAPQVRMPQNASPGRGMPQNATPLGTPGRRTPGTRAQTQRPQQISAFGETGFWCISCVKNHVGTDVLHAVDVPACP